MINVLGGRIVPRILFVEDDEAIAEFVYLELKHEGYDVEIAHDGQNWLERALTEHWDVILLDIMLPEISGMEICRRVRSVSDVPIIMLTARQSVPDRVAGLDIGADDYISKPFAIEELLARIRVLLRRNFNQNTDMIIVSDLKINVASREVWRNNQPITLSAREFDLLELLARNKNRVMTREMILEKIWGYDFPVQSNSVDVYIKHLRDKIDNPFEKSLIQTVRGVGYILKA
jgi:DNA-binding response OmpR family regulator